MSVVLAERRSPPLIFDVAVGRSVNVRVLNLILAQMWMEALRGVEVIHKKCRKCSVDNVSRWECVYLTGSRSFVFSRAIDSAIWQASWKSANQKTLYDWSNSRRLIVVKQYRTTKAQSSSHVGWKTEKVPEIKTRWLKLSKIWPLLINLIFRPHLLFNHGCSSLGVLETPGASYSSFFGGFSIFQLQ